MKPLRAKMLRYMERRGYSESTIRTYTMWVSQFALHYGKSPGLLSEEDIGAYLDYLRRGRGLSQSSLAGCYSGIKLLWEKVLGRYKPCSSKPASVLTWRRKWGYMCCAIVLPPTCWKTGWIR